MCEEKGATNVSVIDSIYWNYKYPDSPKIFEIIFKLDSNIKILKNICNNLMNEFLNSYNNLPRIWIEQNDGSILNFVKESNNGKLQVSTPANLQSIAVNTRVIEVINPEEYKKIEEK